MKKLEELNLNEAEVLDRSAFMAYSSTSGTSGSSGGTSGGSGSSGSDSSGICSSCPKDECEKDSDCGSSKICYSKACGFLDLCSYKKCRDMNNVENACEGKDLCDTCTSKSNDGSYTFTGKCSRLGFNGILFCKAGLCTKN